MRACLCGRFLRLISFVSLLHRLALCLLFVLQSLWFSLYSFSSDSLSVCLCLSSHLSACLSLSASLSPSSSPTTTILLLLLPITYIRLLHPQTPISPSQT